MKFKVGDRVKVRKDLKYNNFYGGNRVNDEMVNNKGKILTIIGIDNGAYLMEGSQWFWTDEMFESKEYTYEDLKKSPIGTKIFFESGYILTKTKKDYYENEMFYRESGDLKGLKDNCGNRLLGKIIKIEEPEYTKVYEAKVEILDDVVKRYLRGVIRPYLDRIKSIEKFIFSTGRAKITITVKDGNDYWYINLPPFEKDTMYKNMKDDEQYTLEELGLKHGQDKP